MDGVFISYARDDVAVARQLTPSLEEEGVTSWRDIAEIPAGATWARYLDDAVGRVGLPLTQGGVTTHVRRGVHAFFYIRSVTSSTPRPSRH